MLPTPLAYIVLPLLFLVPVVVFYLGRVNGYREGLCDGRSSMDHALALGRETAGNPFFAGGILRHMAETGALLQDADGRWPIGGVLADRALPDSVRSVVGQRVARLGEPTQAALRAASVIGRDFDFGVLARVLDGDDDALLDLLDGAVAAALIAEVPGTQERFTFTHALVQHTLYADLSATRRRRLHLRVGEVLEAEYGKDPGERIGQLATHWLAAAPVDSAKAVHYARLAGERAVAQLAPAEAVRWFHAALERLDDLADIDEIERAQILVCLGTAQRDTGDPDYRQTLLDAAKFAQQIDHTPTIVAAALANNDGFHSITRQCDEERTAFAVSGDHRDASSSACDGDLHPRVCRGRSLSSAATASRSAWEWTLRLVRFGKN